MFSAFLAETCSPNARLSAEKTVSPYFRDSYEIDSIADDLKVEVKIGKPHKKYPKNVLILDNENIHLFLSGI